MKIGYCRVSQSTQDPTLQLDALERAGCERIFQDVGSGSRDERPGLKAAIEFARHGDVICVYRFDRLSRGARHLLQVVEELAARGIGLQSVTEQIDTSSTGGKVALAVFAALAQVEVEHLRERTRHGLKAAAERGPAGRAASESVRS